jgi:alpha/beta superfamily hydrolase
VGTRKAVVVVLDLNTADDPLAFAVLLHPHPSYGGDRFHPFIDALFRRLPGISVNAIRFDFSSSEDGRARKEVIDAIDEGTGLWPQLRAVLVGYSFGAGIAARVADARVLAWYLLAPPVAMLATAQIREVARPKALAVPEHDQFSPAGAVAEEVAGWQAATVTNVPHADHFLGAVDPIADAALTWIGQILAR